LTVVDPVSTGIDAFLVVDAVSRGRDAFPVIETVSEAEIVEVELRDA
jgi:hypothetical protein